MAQKYERVLDLMKAKGGTLSVDDPDLAAILKRVSPATQYPEGDSRRESLVYRLPTYISYIRRKLKLNVKGIGQGKHVVAYQLAPTDAAAPVTATKPS